MHRGSIHGHADCIVLFALMTKAAKSPTRIWGSAIVGFGLHGAGEESGLLVRLGKHKTGKGCLYVARMGDIDAKAREKMAAVAARARING